MRISIRPLVGAPGPLRCFIGARFVVRTELPPTFALAGVVVAARRYSAVRGPDDVGAVVVVPPPGTLLEPPGVPAATPGSLTSNLNVVAGDPCAEIEPLLLAPMEVMIEKAFSKWK